MKKHTPSKDLHLEVRAAFVRKGTSFNGWCRTQHVCPSNARQCLMGVWDGPKGRSLRDQILQAAGLNKEAAA